MAATVVSFGEWLPDQPELGNGGLTEAMNVIPKNGGYVPLPTLVTEGTTSPALTSIFDAIHPYSQNVSAKTVYVASGARVYRTADFGATWTTVSATVSSLRELVQFEEFMVACSADGIFGHTLGSVATMTAFATFSSSCIGTVGQFVVAGNLATAGFFNEIRWCAIGDVTNWPTPGSATATATQAGSQILDSAVGRVTAIVGGDQFAVVLQTGGVVRMTYVGAPTVFQFDTVDGSNGCSFPRSVIKVGDFVYFASMGGFFVTDGVSVRSISDGRTTVLFRALVEEVSAYLDLASCMSVGIDRTNKAIIWSFLTISGTARALFIYSYAEDRWSHSDAQVLRFVKQVPGLYGNLLGGSDVEEATEAFSMGGLFGRFTGTAGSATIETKDIELNPGGRAYVDGVKPQVESTGTAPAVTVRVGSRNDLGTTSSYTATTTPTTRTGYADFRVDAKYHRAEVQIVGNFTKATGIVVKAFATGET